MDENTNTELGVFDFATGCPVLKGKTRISYASYMLLATVVETSRRIAETAKRLEKIDLLASLLGQLAPEEIEIVVAFLSGRTRQGQIGVGYAALRSARGPAAEIPSLALIDLDRTFQSIAAAQGPGSGTEKLRLVHDLFARSTQPEQQFVEALLLGELRQGALAGLMLEAVAKASGVPLERVRHAAMVAGDITVVAPTLIEMGEAGLAQYDIQMFRPVQPMLAQTAESVADALSDLGEAALEFKLDGARVQVHRSGDDVAVFSRRMNNVTAAVPEIVEAARRFPAKEFILDGEALCLMPDGRPQPFQVTMRRFGRKLEVERMRQELPLSPFWFDVLYLNGSNLLREPQARRFAALTELSPPELVIPHAIASNASRGQEFLEQSLGQGHEGIMVKALDAFYAAGGRGESWLKVKQARSLDLVVTAAEWGHGRRRGWLSNLHLGARDTGKGGFAMLGKTFKGLTDEMLAWQTQELLKLEIGRDSYTVYVEPKLVVEIAFNEIQMSPRYPSGLALRFARVKRYRLDKSAGESDTFQTVQRMAGA